MTLFSLSLTMIIKLIGAIILVDLWFDQSTSMITRSMAAINNLPTLNSQQLRKLEYCANQTYGCVKLNQSPLPSSTTTTSSKRLNSIGSIEARIYCCCQSDWLDCRKTLGCDDGATKQHQESCRLLSNYDRIFKRSRPKNLCENSADGDNGNFESIQCNGVGLDCTWTNIDKLTILLLSLMIAFRIVF
ncbi:Lachesin [Sarcoptes scabiei]|nr:Lachesin [Sarcoptes scabiei]